MRQPRPIATARPKFSPSLSTLPAFAVLDELAALAVPEALFVEESLSAVSVLVEEAVLVEDFVEVVVEETAAEDDVTSAVALLDGSGVVMKALVVLLEGAEMPLIDEVMGTDEDPSEAEAEADAVEVAAAEDAELESCSQIPFETCCVSALIVSADLVKKRHE